MGGTAVVRWLHGDAVSCNWWWELSWICLHVYGSFYSLCMCVYICVHACACVGDHWGQERPFNRLEPQLEVVVSCPMWVLGTELQPSARAVCILTTEPSLQSCMFISPNVWGIFFFCLLTSWEYVPVSVSPDSSTCLVNRMAKKLSHVRQIPSTQTTVLPSQKLWEQTFAWHLDFLSHRYIISHLRRKPWTQSLIYPGLLQCSVHFPGLKYLLAGLRKRAYASNYSKLLTDNGQQRSYYPPCHHMPLIW